MRTMKEKYAAFAELALTTDMDYRSICRKVKVSPVDMNEHLLDELGMDGETLLEEAR